MNSCVKRSCKNNFEFYYSWLKWVFRFLYNSIKPWLLYNSTSQQVLPTKVCIVLHEGQKLQQCKIHVLICQIKVNLKRTRVIFFPTTKFNFDKLNQLDIVLWLFLNEVLCSVFVGKFTKISYIFIHVLYVRGIFFASHLSRKFLLLFKVYFYLFTVHICFSELIFFW